MPLSILTGKSMSYLFLAFNTTWYVIYRFDIFLYRVKTNISHAPSFRFLSCTEYLTVGYFDSISKRRIRDHVTEDRVSNVLQFPAVTRKLRHVVGAKTIVNPYQKPQRLMNRLIDLFSLPDDWILDLFAGTGMLCIFYPFTYVFILVTVILYCLYSFYL